MEASPEMKVYFDKMESEVGRLMSLATEARKKGLDPETKVDIPLAKGVAQRVEGLVSAIIPEILHSGVAERILELEKEFGSLDWRVALRIAEEVSAEKFIKFESKEKALETGVRVGLAYITLGVISAPLEGFIELKLKKTRDGKEYVSAFFAGPIRAAGGTAEAVSLIIADYVRMKAGYARYDPTEKEIKRYAIEIRDYHERSANLQYYPSEEEITFLVKNLPIEVNGDPTEEIEVSNYKDLDRVETNRIRGGICLVLAEGLAQKAPKVYKQIKKWGKEFGLDWGFLAEFLEIQKRVKAKGEVKKDTTTKISPNYTFIKDLVAGRPVFSYPMRYGGFRLRYGRTRTTGLAAAAIHPQTMNVLADFVATGTQLKVERPGKAAAIVVCDVIDGPIVKFRDGSVRQLKTEDAKPKQDDIERIIFLGDILFSYGDFSENNHKLVPSGYCAEWWIKEVRKKMEERKDYVFSNQLLLDRLLKEKIPTDLTAKEALSISKELGVPLHPTYTYFWTALTIDEFRRLYDWLCTGVISEEKVVIANSPEKDLLERTGIDHLLVNKEFVVIEKEHAAIIEELIINRKEITQDTALAAVSMLLGIILRDKAGTFIGARMGRPEKAKMRKLLGSPHMLFPVGSEGGRLRSFQAAIEAGKITAEFPVYFCMACKKETSFPSCEDCKTRTVRMFSCDKCGMTEKKCVHESRNFRRKEVDIAKAFKTFTTGSIPELVKGVRGTSNKDHTPEHLFKGILRARNNIYVNKDGTTRYDMIETPITHFKPSEIGTTLPKLKELGYLLDIHGNALVDQDQVLELKPQDCILPGVTASADETADDTLFKVANFIDDELEQLYKLPRYYNLKSKKDLVGHLIIGLAPHTSAGIVGRLIGFSKTQGMFTHPMFHAAMRRNCDGDEACAILLLDAFLNFSRSFLPDKRGSRTMDAPLVLTSLLVPGEVDDEVHGLDIGWDYPLELYEAAQEYKGAGEVKILQIDHVLNTPKQYEGMGYTHETTSINSGVLCSAYKILPTMQDKLKGQMMLAEKICAVDSGDVAQLVIEKHFIKDIKGNLRKFSTQQFRCGSCNTKFRRPPLAGKCTACGGKILFTISEGSIVKYLEPTLDLARKYKVSTYLQQTLLFLEKQVLSILGKEKEKQEALGKWFTQ
ncbi:MAG: DNA polymerase II large subunit [Nanoarchaeota archaeon]|nr:DNA polymerase II large subunit [Nanoarchaeota archaeon]